MSLGFNDTHIHGIIAFCMNYYYYYLVLSLLSRIINMIILKSKERIPKKIKSFLIYVPIAW